MSMASLSALVASIRRTAERDLHGLSDDQLLDRFTTAQDEAAFTQLVNRHGPMVLSACRRVLRHEQDAEDAFQAAFLVLARKAGSLRQRNSVAGWLHQVAHRLAVRAKIVGERRRRQTLSLCHADGVASVRDDPGEAAHLLLDEELERLPEQYRSAVVLCYLEGRTQNEAARLLATTAHAVNSRLKRARELLRARLVRQGWALSAAALVAALEANTTKAALTAPLIQLTVRTALNFVTCQAPACAASTVAVALAKGALPTMIPAPTKILSALVLTVILMTGAALFMLPPASGENPALFAVQERKQQPIAVPLPKPDNKEKPKPSCIILWMGGGPSQIDTFDPKPGNVALFKAIDTNVKGMQFTENFPKLAKQAHHLAVIRSLTHREASHQRATYLMRTGYVQGPLMDYPALGCVLAKELGDNRPDLPRYILLGGRGAAEGGFGPSFLGEQYAPLVVGGKAAAFGLPLQPGEVMLPLPPAEAFEALSKGKGERLRNAVTKAFDLGEEKAAVRDAYGRTQFGQSCLLARRLIDRGVPVVEVMMGGWDAHGNAAAVLQSRCADLDAGFAALLKDLHESKRLDSTLVIWMGEFGRTPTVNPAAGRDHWPLSFSALLAGKGIQGGQAIGKTSADGTQIEARPVTPPELLATIYQALGVDISKKNATATGERVPLVENGTKTVQEALR